MMGTCTVLSVLLPWGTGCKVWPQGLVLLPWIWGCSERRDGAGAGMGTAQEPSLGVSQLPITTEAR